MATATQTSTTYPPIDAAYEQFKDLGDRFTQAAREAGVLYVETVEKAVDRTAELEIKLAEATQQEWLESLIKAHAKVVREVGDSYTSAARSLLK
jgi:hypothetical protein